MKRLSLPLLFFCTTLLFSQSKIDSLQQAYTNAVHDTVRVKILQELFGEYKYDSITKAKATILSSIALSEETGNIRLQIESLNKYADFLGSRSSYDSASIEYHKALRLSEKINFNSGLFESLSGLGNLFWRKGNFEKAKEFHEKSFENAKKSKGQEDVVHYYNNMANIYVETGEYVKAMELYTKAAEEHKAKGNIKDYGIILGNIALIQRRLEDYPKAIAYLEQSDSIFNLVDYLPGKAFVEYSLAVVYKNSGKLKEALKYNRKALKSYELLGNIKRQAYAQYTMGSINWEQKNYEGALVDYKKAHDLSLAIKDSVNVGYCLKAIGDAHHKLNNNKEAKENLLRALDVSKAIQLNLIEMDACESLASIYESEKNYGEALKYKNMFIKVKDSFYVKEKRGLAAEIEAKYQNEEKTKEIALLESDKKLQTLQLAKRVNERNAIIALTIILLLLAGLLYNQYRIKQKTNKELRELDELKSNFFANISHEFRTPLTLIKGPIEQLEQNPAEGLKIESIKMIRRNTNRVLQLVNQLLDLSKIDKGSLQLEQTEGEVFKCLRGAASSFSSHAAQRGIDYKVQIPHELFWASFDRDKLEKIIYNLLGNAFKFSDDGETISFSASYLDNELRIVVSDTGKGIPEEKLPFIFDRFYQVQQGTTREHEGSGIGLSLSKELVALMDGTITASSEIDKGTIFTVALPIQKIKTGTLASEPTFPPNPNADAVKKPFELERKVNSILPRLLLVEDNPDMSYFIKEHLQELYHVQEAKNGKLGLEAAKQNPPDLIITDVMMPEMDGVELCKAVKSNLDTSHVPVIMLTAKAGIENKIEGLEMGADDYLTKPFEPKELLARVKNLIEQRKKLRNRFSQREVFIDPKEIAVTSLDQKFLEELLGLLEQEFSNSNFGVREMQEHLAQSKTQLHRKLKALTGESPGELLRNFRLKRAAQLLSKKADTVTQIAYMVGFNNLSYFAKCFKELYGVSPSAY